MQDEIHLTGNMDEVGDVGLDETKAVVALKLRNVLRGSVSRLSQARHLSAGSDRAVAEVGSEGSPHRP
ncbi:MAG: hypothetical protein WKG07_00155 [Hymenobacter sp.]